MFSPLSHPRQLRLVCLRLGAAITLSVQSKPHFPTSTPLSPPVRNQASFSMNTKMASRLERLVPLVQSDLDNLPNRPPSTISDDSSGGGVPLSVEPNETVPPTEHVGNFTEPFVEPAPNPLTTSFLVPEESPDRRFVWVEGAASSYNLGSAPKLSTLPAVQLPPTSLSKGQLAPAGYNFTPITALSKFPYKFCNRDHTQDIASAFFDANKFWNRAWDLYFVWDIDENLSKPLILVPESQVDQLLKEINSTLNLQVRITNQQREDGLVGRFPDHPRCTPRYLGRSHTKAEFENMVADTPSTDGGVLPTGRTLEDFKKLMEEMWDIQKNKSKAQKEKKKQEQIVKRQVLVQQFKRAQRYLGLRPSIQGGQYIQTRKDNFTTNSTQYLLLSILVSRYLSSLTSLSFSYAWTSSRTRGHITRSPRLVSRRWILAILLASPPAKMEKTGDQKSAPATFESRNIVT
jgi:hypothetical protein